MDPDGRCSVLIVEDDPSITEFVESLLRDEGYETETVRSGEDALPRVDESPPDVVLLDLLLPGISGTAFLAELRARHGRAVPVIAMTAAREPVEGAAETEGLLLKPFELNDLVREIERVLAGRPC